MQQRLIRDYENPELPVSRRVSSLGRRFACLERALGLDPWDPEELIRWAERHGEGTAPWHACSLLLSLHGDERFRFDVIGALEVLSEQDRKTLANWVLSWR